MEYKTTLDIEQLLVEHGYSQELAKQYVQQPAQSDNEERLKAILNAEKTIRGGNKQHTAIEAEKTVKADHGIELSFGVTVNILNKSTNPLPYYVKNADSGFDLRAWLSEPVVLKSLQRRLIPTGIHVELPFGHELQVRPRSGLALKQGLTVLNTPGTVDRGYLGEIGVILINLSTEEVTINNGDRIAQAVIAPVASEGTVKLVEIAELTERTMRGADGFGSTGIN